MKAAEAGVRAHNGGNIRASGQPLEAAFQRLFNEALPKTFDASSGYFFDNDFCLSPQVDFVLSEQGALLNLPPAADIDDRYVPYRTVKVLGQLKNSAPDFRKAVTQHANALKLWQSMAARYPNPDRVHPLSIIVVGRGGADASIRESLKSSKGELPAYVFFVEAGLLYATSTTESLSVRAEAFFSYQGNGGPMFLLDAPGPNPRDSGLLLLWLFFAILRHVTPKEDGTTASMTHGRIVERVEEKYRHALIGPPIRN